MTPLGKAVFDQQIIDTMSSIGIDVSVEESDPALRTATLKVYGYEFTYGLLKDISAALRGSTISFGAGVAEGFIKVKDIPL